MTMQEIIERIRALDEHHREDGDGGYALLAELLDYGRTLSEHDRDVLRDELVRLVGVQDQTMWGVALEALVTGWGCAVAGDLASLLDQGDRTDEWEAHIVLALLRLEYQPIAGRATAHIKERVSIGDRTVLPLLAALCKVDAHECLQITAPFLIEIVRSGAIEQMKGYIPAIANHFLDADPALLALLIREIANRDQATGVAVADLVCDFLDRPYVSNSLGKAKAYELKMQIRAVV